MAFEADKVVVALIAENDQFDAAAKASAANFSQSMGDIQKSGAAAEKGVGQFSSALKENRLQMNQSRIGMMEFQHIARGVSDQIAAGAPATQILTQHLGMLGEAAALSGGAFGKFGAFLMTPYGNALTLAVVVGTKLLVNLLDQKNALDQTYDKLLKSKEQTELNAEAEDKWSHTLDGLIDQTKKLREELDKRVLTQSALNDQLMRTVQLKYAESLNAEAQLEASGADPKLIKKVSDEVTQAAIALHEAQQTATEATAKGSTDLNQAAKDWIDAQRRMMEQIIGEHPELTTNVGIQAAVDAFDKAAQEAAAANMDFHKFGDQVHTLDTQLLNGSISADTFAQKMNGITQSLIASTAAFKNQDSAISKFKQAVIGAEGVGPNKLGSSAAGFGQFMPSTFESYFKRLYPDQAAGMTNAQIDALRNNRQIAEAVISAATDDYVKVLKSAGQQITEAALYTVHLLGPAGARRLFAAAPDTPTSSLFSSSVLNGNPFLRGTAADARAAIAQRIGDSNSAISAGAAAVNEQLQKQVDLWQRISDAVQGALTKNVDISDELKHQSDLVPKITKEELLDESALSQLADMAKIYTDQLNEATQMGDQFVQDVLNPDNWKSFGSIAHTVLMDILRDLETIAVLNPIENWLDGGHRLTFGSLFGLFGKGASGSSGGTVTPGDLGIPGMAGGGAFRVNGGTDTNLLSINGQPRARVSADETIAVIPNNATAASPLAAAQSMVRFIVEASPYFDGRVADISGPIAVQAGTRGAYAGAGLARNDLARRQLHQLGN